MRIRKPTLVHRQTGSSLLEVLVSILIMSFGMLGLAGMTVSSLQYGKMAQFQTVGSQLAASYGESIRGNITGFLAGNYNQAAAYTGATTSIAVPTCATPAKCTPAELAAIDLAEWNNNLRRRLPGGGAYVVRDLPADPTDLASNSLAADIWVLYVDPSLVFDKTDKTSDLSVAASGGNQCPAAALAGLSDALPVPRCMYFRVSL